LVKTMNKLALPASLMIAGAIAATDSACTITVNNNDDGGGAQGPNDLGGSDATAADTGTQSDSAQDSPADAGMQADAAAATEAGTCSVGIDTGIAACDQCIEAACCQQWVTCATPDGAGVDDAGASACVQLTQCVQDWVAADAGSLSSGEVSCGGAYSQSERDASHAFLVCKQGCSTQCGG
jgi:hypothetical protein